MRWVWLLGVGLLLAVGCGEDAEHTLDPPAGPEYLANDSPDNVIDNVVRAMTAMDAEGYAALLYDGVLPATDGLPYAPYKFYFDRGVDSDLPELFPYEREIDCLSVLLGGEPGLDSNNDPVPGVRSVAMSLWQIGVWTVVAGGEVEDDPCPEDTRWRAYNTDFLFTLKGTYGQNTTAWRVEDRLMAHCIPVLVGGETEWRLWKWRDLLDAGRAAPSSAATQASSLSHIKVLYDL